MSSQEQETLNLFFSNLNKNVFVLKNMPEVLKGALFSRYSRSPLPLRDLFLKEYLNNTDINVLEYVESLKKSSDQTKNLVNSEKANKFYSKWLAMYGDDSIAELAGIHIAIENISVLATKSIEDRRIGISPLEKSTRYVRFDDKEDGHYRYFRDPEIINSPYGSLYISTLDQMFNTYSQLMEPMSQYFRQKFPKADDISDSAYEASIRAKACDTLRGLLPAATLTNMGIFANGRALEYLLTKMYSSQLDEVKSLARQMHEESKKFIPNFVERLENENGENYISYLKNVDKSTWEVSNQMRVKNPVPLNQRSVRLLDFDKDAENKIVASILFPFAEMPYESIFQQTYKMSEKEKLNIINDFIEGRKGRWHKVGRAFEEIYYSFEVVSDMGAYKDLQRHRIATTHRQLFTTELGYEIPTDIKLAGYEEVYKSAMDLSNNLYKVLKTDFPTQAQYVVGHGHLIRWRTKINLREAFHLCELRSSPQGHPNYRVIAQDMHKIISEVNPILGKVMKFVNHEDPGLERLSAEVRKEERLKVIASQ